MPYRLNTPQIKADAKSIVRFVHNNCKHISVFVAQKCVFFPLHCTFYILCLIKTAISAIFSFLFCSGVLTCKKELVVVFNSDHKVSAVADKEPSGFIATAAASANAFNCFNLPLNSDPLRRALGFGTKYPEPLYGGNIVTCVPVLVRPTIPSVFMRYESELLKTPHDGEILRLDWRYARGVVRRARDVKDAPAALPAPKGIIAIIPGITSHSASGYIQRFVLHANSRGFHVVVINARGMGDTPFTKSQIANANFTEDLNYVFSEHLSSSALERRFGLFPRRVPREPGASDVIVSKTPLPVFAVGFSLGGATIVKYLADAGTRSHIHAAASVCAPLDLQQSSLVMEAGLWSRFVYSVSIVHGLVSFVHRHYNTLLRPNLPGSIEKFLKRVKDGYWPKSVREFDRYYTAPADGFPTVDAYYKSASPLNHFSAVKIPLLVLTAKNDPITGPPPPQRALQRIADQNPNLLFVDTPTGGHLGFLSDPLSEFLERPTFVERFVVATFERAAQYVYNREMDVKTDNHKKCKNNNNKKK